jgi:hypothetical protein
MRGLRLSPSRSVHRPPRPYRFVVSLLAALALLAVPAVALAANGFTEQVASARWSTPFQCPDGTFSWGSVRAAPTQFDPDLKAVSASGTFATVRDNRGGLHTVSVNARWTGTGPVMTTVNGPGSKRKERAATATATIGFDGNTLVDGAANFPFPAPFIRVDTEK